MLFGVLFHVCLYIYCSKLKLDIFKGILPKTSTSTLPEKYLKYSTNKNPHINPRHIPAISYHGNSGPFVKGLEFKPLKPCPSDLILHANLLLLT